MMTSARSGFRILALFVHLLSGVLTVLLESYFTYARFADLDRALFERDRHTCLYCGSSFRPSLLTRDHVLPRALGDVVVSADVSEAEVVAAIEATRSKP